MKILTLHFLINSGDASYDCLFKFEATPKSDSAILRITLPTGYGFTWNFTGFLRRKLKCYIANIKFQCLVFSELKLLKPVMRDSKKIFIYSENDTFFAIFEAIISTCLCYQDTCEFSGKTVPYLQSLPQY